MNCFNSDTYLKEAINSIYAQTYKNWEIIFWDNQSTDKSAKIAKSYNNKLKYFLAKKYTGLCEARALAMGKTNGKFIAFLDCDDLWLPTKLEKQVKLFEDKNVGLVYSNTITIGLNGIEKKGLNNNYRGYCFKQLLGNYVLQMPSVIIRKRAIQNINFDKSLKLCCDFDLFLQIAYDNKIDFVEDFVTKRRIQKNSLTKTDIGFNFEKEFKIIMHKFSKLYKGFFDLFGNEIKKSEASLVFQRAVYEFKNVDSVKARVTIRKYIFINWQYFVFYIVTFIPTKLVLKILQWK